MELLAHSKGVLGPGQDRLAFLNNLKAWLTLQVVMHHAGQPYGPTGGAWPVSHVEKFALLGAFFHVNASFFMGLFFLISGYFVPASFDRKGVLRFLGERFRKLGLPVLALGMVVFPLLKHFRRGDAWSESFLPFEWAHLWFLGHLLIYALLYVICRRIRPLRAADGHGTMPGHRAILLYVPVLAAVSTLVRSVYPMDEWVRFIVTAEPAHFPQYASLFVIGVIAARGRWLERIPPHVGRPWLAVALAATALRYTVLPYLLPEGGLLASFAWNTWEAALCAGSCIGLPYWFSRHGNSTAALPRFAARHAFAVYVIHLPVLVLIQLKLEASSLGPLTLTVLSGAATLLVCYAVAAAWAVLSDKWGRLSVPRLGCET
jgi:fucose 4-O-acetylase-like acetyltransferase